MPTFFAFLSLAYGRTGEPIIVTAQQREACSADVMRLCAEALPHVAEVAMCLKEKRAQLSAPCLAAIPSQLWKMRARDMDRIVIK